MNLGQIIDDWLDRKEDGYEIARLIINNGKKHEIARLAAKIALEYGANEANTFCDLLEETERTI